MSVIFEVAGRKVWHPTSTAAKIFCAQCDSAAQILGVRSGVGPPINDEVVLDADAFEIFVLAFAKHMLEIPREYRGPGRLLLRGCFAIALAIYSKLDRQNIAGADEYLALGNEFVE